MKSFSYIIPTAMFQSINPASIVIFGGIIAYILKRNAKSKFALSSIMQVMTGVALMTLGYIVVTWCAAKAEFIKPTMWWIISGMTVLSVAEIFIDPVILGVITKAAPEKSLSTMTAVYYVFGGAAANYLAAQVAKLTAAPTGQASAILYKNTYNEFIYVGLAMIICLFILHKLRKIWL
jgi:POT family proton-dependent oligopeptide transporter